MSIWEKGSIRLRCSASAIQLCQRRLNSFGNPKRIFFDRKVKAISEIGQQLTTQHILDSYDALTVEEKNSLWKLVMRRATIYREPEGEVRFHIYPNLPR